MALLRWVFLTLIGIVLIILAVTNRQLVILRFLPEEFAVFMSVPNPIELPLFLVIFIGLTIGLLIGFVWEWMREMRQRREAAAERRRIAKLEREIKDLKQQNKSDESDILALLE